ncbi:MAG: hypothetical protein Q9182_006016 [Xanthomendoza sp. 2 TL-2023]
MTESTNIGAPALIPIAQLEPSINISEKAVEGIVTLIWPYSISSQTFSILLAEPDFRLRRQRGQIRVRFSGSSAKAVARCDIQSGDRVTLNLLGAQWERDETGSGASGRGVEWELRFEEQTALKIQREDQEPIVVHIDHPAPSPERRMSSPPVIESSSLWQPPSTPHSISAITPRLQAWSTPAFLKRDRLSAVSYFGSDYDPFDEDEFRDNNRRKKTKFGRASNQWKFTEQTSSPESTAGSRSPVAEQPAVDEPRNGLVIDHASIVESRTVDGVDPTYDAKKPNGHSASHKPLVDAGIQVEDDLMNETANEKQPHGPADVVFGPTIEPQTPISALEDTTQQTSPQKPGLLEPSNSAEIAENKEVPTDNLGLLATVGTHSTNGDTDGAYRNGAASPPISNTERPPGFVPPDQASIAGRRDHLSLDEAKDGDKSAAHEDLPGVDANKSSLFPRIKEQYHDESVGERLLQDEPSRSRDSHVFNVLQVSRLSDMEQIVEPALEPESNQPAFAEDEREAPTSVEETENAHLSNSSPEKSLPYIVEQADGDDQGSSLAVEDTYPSRAEMESIEETIHATICPTSDEINRRSSEERAKSKETDASEVISSRSSSPLPGQVVAFSSSPPQETETLEDLGTPRGFSVESRSEEEVDEDAHPLKRPSEILSDDGQGEEYSEEDSIMNDERPRDLADIKPDEEEKVSRPEVGNDDGGDVPETKGPDDQDPDGPGVEQLKTAAAPRSSGVEVITIDDSDEDHINVAQNQTDVASRSSFSSSGIKCESHPTELLSPIQKQGSPYLGSPTTLPDTIPDSQAAVDAGGPETNMKSNMSEAEEVHARSPKTARSVSEVDFDEELEDFIDQEEVEIRSLAASASPEIPVEDYIDPRLKNKAMTPSDTQVQEKFSQASNGSLRSLRETHDLPTPRLTQNRSSDILLPASLRPSSPSLRSLSPPALQIKTSSPRYGDEPRNVVDRDSVDQSHRLEDKAQTPVKSSSRSRRVSNIPASVSPWFAPKRSSEIVLDSRSQSEHEDDDSHVSSSDEEDSVDHIRDLEDERLSFSPEAPYEQPTSKPTNHENNVMSPAPTASSQPGLRTSHAYYAPLSTLPSHFNTSTSTLSLVLASTPITRANSGPRDFYTTIFLTDPSSLQDNTPFPQDSAFFTNPKNDTPTPFMLARLFRPSRPSLPQQPKKGDILLLRSVTVTHTRRAPSLLSTATSAWALFSPSHPSDPAIAGPPVEFGAEERGYVRGLWEWWDQLPLSTKDGVLAHVEAQYKKLEERAEREKLKGRRLKGMGLRLAPGSKVQVEGRHELRDGKEWRDDISVPRTSRKGRGVGGRRGGS